MVFIFLILNCKNAFMFQFCIIDYLIILTFIIIIDKIIFQMRSLNDVDPIGTFHAIDEDEAKVNYLDCNHDQVRVAMIANCE